MTSTVHPAVTRFQGLRVGPRHTVEVANIFTDEFDEVVFLLRPDPPSPDGFTFNVWLRPEDFTSDAWIQRITNVMDAMVNGNLTCQQCHENLGPFRFVSQWISAYCKHCGAWNKIDV